MSTDFLKRYISIKNVKRLQQYMSVSMFMSENLIHDTIK